MNQSIEEIRETLDELEQLNSQEDQRYWINELKEQVIELDRKIRSN